MRNLRIARVLKYYRKKNHISIEEVVQYLSEQLDGKKYSAKTVYGWESGVSQPAADILLYLCNLYGIENVLVEFGWSQPQKEPEIKLTEEERELIWAYRANKPMQKVVQKILDIQ